MRICVGVTEALNSVAYMYYFKGINPPRAEFIIGSTRIQCFQKKDAPDPDFCLPLKVYSQGAPCLKIKRFSKGGS